MIGITGRSSFALFERVAGNEDGRMSGVIRGCGAFLTVILASAAGFGYVVLFIDEMDPSAPVNVAAGALAPMYRHWVEFVLIEWTTFVTVVAGYYWVFGFRAGIHVNWPQVRRWLFWLHLLSGAVLTSGLLIAVVIGQPLQFRDLATASIGIGLLGMSVYERTDRRIRFKDPTRCRHPAE